MLQLKSAFKDGTTQIVMSPLEFMQRLAALVPRPRLHLIPFDRLRAGRFHGVLAPNAKLRGKIIPSPAERATEASTDDAPRRARRRSDSIYSKRPESPNRLLTLAERWRSL